MIHKEIAVSKIGRSTILETAKQLPLNHSKDYIKRTRQKPSTKPKEEPHQQNEFSTPPSGEPAESAKHGKTAQSPRIETIAEKAARAGPSPTYLKFFRQSVTFFSMPAAEYSRRSNFCPVIFS